MAQKYLFIAISFYRNIVRENVSCELGLKFIILFSMGLFIMTYRYFYHGKVEIFFFINLILTSIIQNEYYFLHSFLLRHFWHCLTSYTEVIPTFCLTKICSSDSSGCYYCNYFENGMQCSKCTNISVHSNWA